MELKDRTTARRIKLTKTTRFLLFIIIIGFWLVLKLQTKTCCNSQRLVISSLSPINIAIVACDRRGNYGSAKLAVVMIKSVLISSELYHIHSVHFHVFLEHLANQKFFVSKLKEYGYPNQNKTVNVKLHFYSALAVIPKKYQYRLIYKPPFPKCGFVRFFVSSHLKNIGEILYLDTDTIVTGDISKVWDHFMKMNENQLVAVAPNTMPGPDSDNVHNRTFGGFPYVPPRGLNSGVVLMNLTKMRQFDWDKKLLQAYKNYLRTYKQNIADQTLLNIFLYFQPELLSRIPCHFNYMHIYCDGGHGICPSAEDDPDGIHIVHGAGGYFSKSHSGIKPLHQVYKGLNMSSHNILEDLLRSFRQKFTGIVNESKCLKKLNNLLFKSLM